MEGTKLLRVLLQDLKKKIVEQFCCNLRRQFTKTGAFNQAFGHISFQLKRDCVACKYRPSKRRIRKMQGCYFPIFRGCLDYLDRLAGVVDGLIKKKMRHWLWAAGNLFFGLVCLTGAILSIVYCGGGDLWMVIVDILFGGTGVSLTGWGISQFINFFKTAEFLKRFDAIFANFRIIVKDLQVQSKTTRRVLGDLDVDSPYLRKQLNTIIRCADRIIEHCHNCLNIPAHRSWWTYARGIEIKLEDQLW
jgi:hypothetical protein